MGKNKAFDNNVDSYEAWFEKNNNILDSEVNAIRQLLPAFSKGIEIGTGTGIFASLLSIKDGIEPSIKMSEKAIERGINIINAKAELLPIADNTYQFALMVTVDCFLDDVLQAFREVRRILSDDGNFIVAFIDRGTELGQIYSKKISTEEFYKHANFHDAEEMIAYLEAAGFEIVDKRHTIYTFENKVQEIKNGVGEGVFAVIKAKKCCS